MLSVLLLVSPEVKAAFFSEYIKVAMEELRFTLGKADSTYLNYGNMDFIETSIASEDLEKLVRLSFVQGVFVKDSSGAMTPLTTKDQLYLDERFVFGSKFKGKTNERLTQMLLNLGLAAVGRQHVKILDPMCGRATSLLWAMRYRIEARGIEQDPKAADDILQICKKWQKLSQQELKFSNGFVGKKTKSRRGHFIEVRSPESSFKVITGDASHAVALLQGEKVDIIISDLPYGVQHYTSTKTRNPLATLEACIPIWLQLLKAGGAIVLSYNSYLPKRETLIALFVEHGFTAMYLDASHRMSESIVRDIVVFKKQMDR